MRRFFFATLLLYVLLALSACGDNSSSSDSSSENYSPVADAGSDQNVNINDTVTLDGSASSDADGDLLDFLWTIASAPGGSTSTLSDETAVNPTFTVDVEGDYVFNLVVNDGQEDSAVDSVTVSTQYIPQSDTVAVNFTIDDSANQIYESSDGLAWKGSFNYDPATRLLTFDGAWGGPFPMLYDDGPWTEGGHEPEGATADDHVWGITVWISNTSEATLEYGAISGSVNGSDGAWIWEGANGTVTITAGATTAVDATGLVFLLQAYSFDFEDDNGGFTAANLWEWGTPSVWPSSCASGNACWGTILDGNYPDSSTGTLTSPALNLTGYASGTSIQLSWQQAFHLESSTWDYAYLEVLEGATSIATLWSNNGLGTTQQGWQELTADLSVAAGKNVTLRWVLSSDSSINHEGVYIDDVVITVEE